MKQFIYMDDIVLNSLLAQIDQGLVSAIHQKASNSEKTEINNGFTGKVSIGVSSTNGSTEMTTGNSESETSATEEEQEIIFNDYAVTQLIEKLDLFDVPNVADLPDGSVFKYTAKFKRVDFSELESLLNSNALNSILQSNYAAESNLNVSNLSKQAAQKAIKKAAEKQMSEFDDIKKVIEIGSLSFSQSPIFVSDDKLVIAIGRKEKSRLSNAQMGMINGSNLKLTIIGIKRSNVVFSEIESNDYFSDVSKFLQIPNFLQNLFFNSLEIVNNGAATAQPIALYFDVPSASELD
ncbi:hypothetical protein HXX29_07240 [Weissella confusa]|uniref:DUF6414 family protein n=1 Tax=Weissella confusa TaxID=1583 RepID=UPI00189EC32E|nr:hypothetical protein [Weissella confusa]MBF7058608.1 hypothetical protein [Weissella confusa]